jgi:GntR family transcriptional regulator
LNELTLKGMIHKQRGKKSFVTGVKLEQSWVNKITGFHQYMTERGHSLVTQVLGQELIPANSEIASNLQVNPKTSVVWIKRLRFVDGEPIQLVDSYVSYKLCPELLSEDLSKHSLTDYLEAKGFIGTRGRRTLDAVPANEYQAQVLRINEGAPLMLLESVFCVSDGRPIAYSKAVYRADRTRFEVDLVRIAKSS